MDIIEVILKNLNIFQKINKELLWPVMMITEDLLNLMHR